MSHIYSSIASSLRSNEVFLTHSSRTFRKLLDTIKKNKFATIEDDIRELNFATKLHAREIHHCDERYYINRTLRAEITLLRDMLRDSPHQWAHPIGHLIPRTPSSKFWGNACLHSAGGFSLSLCTWWFYEWPIAI